MFRPVRSRTPRSLRLVVLALPVVVAVGVLPASQADAAAGARITATDSWFHDPLTPDQRAELVPVPDHPRSVHGRLQRTKALWKSHGGGVAVPAVLAQGHQLAKGQGVTLSRRNLFEAGSAQPTMATRGRVTALATSLTQVTAVTCEGYTDFGGQAARESRLARKRAAKVCSLLAADRPGLDTTTRGFGRSVPVVVGGKASQRAANRRVVVIATEGRSVPPPNDNQPRQATAPGAPTLSSVTGGGHTATLVFAAPADDGGSPVTGYEWSTDQTTWTPMSTSGSSPFSAELTSLPVGTATYQVRAVNAIGNGPGSAGVPGTVLDVPNAPSVVYNNYGCNGAVQNYSQVNSDPVFNAVTITGVEYRVNGGPWTAAVNPQLVSGNQYRFSMPESGLCVGTPVLEVRYTSANGPGPATTGMNLLRF